jgi:hypothetical protein
MGTVKDRSHDIAMDDVEVATDRLEPFGNESSPVTEHGDDRR